MDVVQSMSEAVAQVIDVSVEVVHPMHQSSPMVDHVLEEVSSMHKPFTIPLESNSCENYQSVEKEISLADAPVWV